MSGLKREERRVRIRLIDEMRELGMDEENRRIIMGVYDVDNRLAINLVSTISCKVEEFKLQNPNAGRVTVALT